MVHCHTTRKPSGIINYNTPNIILNFIMQLHGNDIMVQSKDRTNCNLVAQSETFYHPTFICVNPQKAAKILHVHSVNRGEKKLAIWQVIWLATLDTIQILQVFTSCIDIFSAYHAQCWQNTYFRPASKEYHRWVTLDLSSWKYKPLNIVLYFVVLLSSLREIYYTSSISLPRLEARISSPKAKSEVDKLLTRGQLKFTRGEKQETQINSWEAKFHDYNFVRKLKG